MKIFPALYRRYKNSAIRLTHYDCKTGMLEDLKLDIPIDYIAEDNFKSIEEIPEVVYSNMYNVLMKDSTISAVVLCNLDVPVKVFADRVSDKGFDRYTFDTYALNNFHFLDNYPAVGLELTEVKSFRVYSSPGKILYSPVRKEIFFNGQWYPYSEKVSELDINKSLYRRLIKEIEDTEIEYTGIVKLKGKNKFDYL